MIISPLQKSKQLAKKDDDTGESGGSSTGPKADTYAQIISDLGGVDPQQLQDFSDEHSKDKEVAAEKSEQTTSKEFDQKKAKEKQKSSEETSEKKYEINPEQPFKPRGPGSR